MSTNNHGNTESVEVRSIVRNGAVELEVDRIYPSVSSEDGLTVQDAEQASRTTNCGHCEPCIDGCCENGVCNQSRATDNSRIQTRNNPNGNYCVGKKRKSVLFRTSTNLLFSGLCMMGVTGLSIADIATDILTAREYYLSGQMIAFSLALVFLTLPAILLTAAIIRRRDDSIVNTTTKTTPCYVKFLIVILNVPLKLYMIWLQLVFSYKCFKKFHKWRKSKCLTQEETLMTGPFSHFITELTLYKLWNSIFESMPQLLLSVNVIMTEGQQVLQSYNGYLLIASASFSFSSLCVGIIFYVIKAKEAESQPKTSRRSAQQALRAKSMVLGIPQIILVSIYTVCFLGSRALAISYFIVFFEWFSIIIPGLHWIVVFVFFSYRRYVNQKSTMQHYRMATYSRRSSSFTYVFVHSVMSVFIHVKPECEEVLDQPRYFKFIYYCFFTFENCAMMLMPLMIRELPKYFLMDGSVMITDELLEKYKYYPVTYAVLGALGLGCLTCAFYHVLVHKSAPFTREQVFGPCCKCCYGPGGFLWLNCSSCSCCVEKDDEKIFIACKNMQTHEICKASLSDIKRWKEDTGNKLVNKKPLRWWKKLHNTYKESRSSKEIEAESGSSQNSIGDSEEFDPDCPYTMRRSGLHILSDPHGHLFYAPIADIKSRTIPI